MGIAWGSLMPAIANTQARGLEGRRLGEEERRERERQQRLDAFAEYAKRRQMDQESQADAQRAEYQSGLVDVRRQGDETKRLLGENAQALKDLIAAKGTWKDQQQYNPDGTVRYGIDARTDMNNASIAGRNVNSERDARVRIVLEDKRQDGASDRDMNNVLYEDPDGNIVQVRPGAQPAEGLRPYNKPTGIGGRGGLLTQTQSNTLDEFDDGVAKADQVVQAFQKVKDKGGTFGFAGPVDAAVHKVRTSLLQNSDPDVEEAMRLYQQLTGPEGPKIFGASFTPSEQDRVTYWLAQIKSSNERNLAKVVGQMRDDFKAMRKRRVDAWGASGRNVEGYRTEPTSPSRRPLKAIKDSAR